MKKARLSAGFFLLPGSEVNDSPNPSALIVRDVQRAVRSFGQSDGPMLGTPGGFFRSGKPVGESLAVPDGSSARERKEDDLVAILRAGPVPRTVKGDEGSVSVAHRKLRASIKQQPIGRPMRGERSDRQ